jgi:hypothetical protein
MLNGVAAREVHGAVDLAAGLIQREGEDSNVAQGLVARLALDIGQRVPAVVKSHIPLEG